MSQPKIGILLWRGSIKRCPACGRGKLFTHWFELADDCPRCGLHFERIEGHWMGAIGLNTVLAFAVLLFVVAGGLIVTGASGGWKPIAAAVVTAGVVPILLSPTCRTLWTAIDIAMRPLREDEVDWDVVEGNLDRHLARTKQESSDE